MTPYQTQCVYDALKYSRDEAARQLGYPNYAELCYLFHHCTPADYSRFANDFGEVIEKVAPLFTLWIIKGDL